MPDKDRIIGSAKVVKGNIKEADKIEGKVQNAVGGIKDALKGK